MNIKTLPLILSLLLALCAAASAETIAVYHTSDVHGWYSPRPARWDKENSTRSIGGYPALAALIEKETTPYLLLDSGDTFQGTPEGILTKGMASITLMNQLGYNALVPGNHDFDYTEANFQVLAASAAFPVLAANVYNRSDGANPSYTMPFFIAERGSKRIAVLGIAGRHTATSTLPANVKNLEFRDEAAEVAKWVPEIQKQHPDAIIVLSHIGISEGLSLKMLDLSTWTFTEAPLGTLKLARAAKGIDLVLGGHNHFGLTKGYHDPVSGTWLGESYYGLSYVTRAVLDFDNNTGKLNSITVNLIPLWTDTVGEDPAFTATIAGFSADVEREMGKVIGSAAADLGAAADGLDSALGDWACDVMRSSAGTDLAFNNTAGLRADIKKGDIKIRDLYQTLPFENTLVTMRLNGAQVKQVMADNWHNGASAMQIAGFETEITKAGDQDGIVIKRGGKVIKPEEEFTVVTNNYLAFGGDGAKAFSGGKDVKDTLISMRDTLEKAVAAGPVKAPALGRIKRID